MTIYNFKNQPVKRDKRGRWARIRNYNWRLTMLVAFALAIALLLGTFLVAEYFNTHQWIWRSPVQSPLLIQPRVSSGGSAIALAEGNLEAVVEPLTPKDIMKLDICNGFGFEQQSQNCKIILAITEAEAHFNPRAMGWNCKYSKDGKEYSTACKEADRGKAWSVDCGLMQINVYGQKCPEALFDVKTNVEAGAGKYKRQGFGAWSVFKNESYKKYLAK